MIRNAAIDSHRSMLIDAPKEHSPGLYVAKNRWISSVLIIVVVTSDEKFIFANELIFLLFIASIEKIIDMYVIGMVGDRDLSASEALLKSAPKTEVQIGRENVNTATEKNIKRGRINKVDLSEMSFLCLLLSVLDSNGAKTAFIAGVNTTPSKIILFAAP